MPTVAPARCRGRQGQGTDRGRQTQETAHEHAHPNESRTTRAPPADQARHAHPKSDTYTRTPRAPVKKNGRGLKSASSNRIIHSKRGFNPSCRMRVSSPATRGDNLLCLAHDFPVVTGVARQPWACVPRRGEAYASPPQIPTDSPRASRQAVDAGHSVQRARARASRRSRAAARSPSGAKNSSVCPLQFA